MKYSESLKKNADFNLVYQSGRSLANKYLVMYVRENGVNKNRLGISVSKKVGNSIVCQASFDKIGKRELSTARRSFQMRTGYCCNSKKQRKR